MILAVALANTIGPAASAVYTQCQLATLLSQNNITTNIPDCKYSKIDLKKIYCDDVELINQAEKKNCGEGVL